MPEPIVEYERYRAYYTREGRFKAPMGSFSATLLTPTGHVVRRALTEFLGRPPRHQGVAKGRVYFKWAVSRGGSKAAPYDQAPYLIASDWVRDQGYEVDVQFQTERSTVPAPRRYVKFVIRW